MKLSDHDKVVEGTVRLLSAQNFQVQYVRKGRHRTPIEGDSGIRYYPDIIVQRGLFHLLVDVRTKAQRGQKLKVDRGAIQFLQATLDDLVGKLHKPHGLMITPHGIDDDANILANHFGIYVAIIPMDKIEELLRLDFHSEKDRIREIAREVKLEF